MLKRISSYSRGWLKMEHAFWVFLPFRRFQMRKRRYIKKKFWSHHDYSRFSEDFGPITLNWSDSWAIQDQILHFRLTILIYFHELSCTNLALLNVIEHRLGHLIGLRISFWLGWKGSDCMLTPKRSHQLNITRNVSSQVLSPFYVYMIISEEDWAQDLSSSFCWRFSVLMVLIAWEHKFFSFLASMAPPN